MDLKIECRNMEMDAELQENVVRMTTILRGRHPQLTHIRVVVTRNVHHRNGVQVCEVLVVAKLPRRRTFTARKASTAFGEAIRTAFEALDVEIATFRDKRSARRALVPAHEPHTELEHFSTSTYHVIVPKRPSQSCRTCSQPHRA